jgi:hypothetical protein
MYLWNAFYITAFIKKSTLCSPVMATGRTKRLISIPWYARNHKRPLRWARSFIMFCGVNWRRFCLCLHKKWTNDHDFQTWNRPINHCISVDASSKDCSVLQNSKTCILCSNSNRGNVEDLRWADPSSKELYQKSTHEVYKAGKWEALGFSGL